MSTVLVLDGGDSDAVHTPNMARVLARSAARALRGGRGVSAYGPVGDAAADPTPCGCHATARVWPSGRAGRWVLPARREGLPATPLLPADVAAAFVAAVAVGGPPPLATRHGIALGLSWRVWSPPPAAEPHRHTAVDEDDLADAVAALARDEHLELSGRHPASAAAFPNDGSGWTVELLRTQGQVAREARATSRGELLAAVRVAAAWVVGTDSDDPT